MTVIADILMIAGTLGAAVYCFVLSRRLTKLNDMDDGVGAAVAMLSKQVTELEAVLQQAQKRASEGSESLRDLTHQAEATANRLELLVAAMHDLPEREEREPAAAATFMRRSQRG